MIFRQTHTHTHFHTVVWSCGIFTLRCNFFLLRLINLPLWILALIISRHVDWAFCNILTERDKGVNFLIDISFLILNWISSVTEKKVWIWKFTPFLPNMFFRANLNNLMRFRSRLLKKISLSPNLHQTWA